MTMKIVGRIVWLGRSTATMMGIAVMVAVVLGVGTTALAAVPGDPFELGKLNTIDKISQLVGSVDNAMFRIDNNNAGANATALDLRVEPGKPPMKTNSETRVANLNADKLDGKSADAIGVNGLERVVAVSRFDSESPKDVTVFCPAGKVVVGTGGNVNGALSGNFPDIQTDVVIRTIDPNVGFITVSAVEEEPTSANWNVVSVALCATAP